MAVFGALHPVTPIDPSGAIAQRQTANLPFLAKLELGQHLRATVQAALSNGEFALTLHSQDGQALNGPALHMKLPAGARPGDIFNLTFVARLPRPEFALAADTSLNVESPSLLSGIGRFIGDLLSRPFFPIIRPHFREILRCLKGRRAMVLNYPCASRKRWGVAACSMNPIRHNGLQGRSHYRNC